MPIAGRRIGPTRRAGTNNSALCTAMIPVGSASASSSARRASAEGTLEARRLGGGSKVGAKDPNEIDRLVGSRVRQRRMQLGMSQEQLAAALGITVPQVQKYEKGVNRIGASRLHRIAGLLGVPIGAFFEVHAGAQASETDRGEAEAGGAEAGAAEPGQPDPSVFADRETIALALAFHRITRPQLRRALIELARAVAHLDEPAPDKPVSGA